MVQSYYFLGTYARKLQTFFNLYYSVSKKGAEEDVPDSEKGLEICILPASGPDI